MLFQDQTARIRTRAILYHIYHHSLHDRWYEARDLMLMSHLQDTIMHSDIPTQVRFAQGSRIFSYFFKRLTTFYVILECLDV